MKRILLLTLLVAGLVSLCSCYVIDTFSENTGTATTVNFCTCDVTNTTCVTNPNGATIVGKSRRMILIPGGDIYDWTLGCYSQSLAGGNYDEYCSGGLAVQTGCPITGCSGNYGVGGQLSLSTPPQSYSTTYVIWDAGCAATSNETGDNPVVSNINYRGLGGVDLTDAGVSDSFVIQIGKVDIQATLNVTIFTDATHASTAAFNPQSLSTSANLNGAYTKATIKFSSDFSPIGTAGGADFTNVGAIYMKIIGTNSLDLIIALIETSGALVLTKYANITTDTVPAGVANTGDVITFNLTLSYNGLGTDVNNVYIWDDPSTNYKISPNNYFPYYTLVPGSLIVNYYTINPTTGALTSAALYSNYTQINGPDVQASLGRLVLYLGAVTSYSQYNIFFALRVPNSLPCCLPICAATCTGINREPCYCIANTAYFCEETDAVALNNNSANFNTLFVNNNCGFATVPITSTLTGTISSTTPQVTVTPIYAPTSPMVVISTPSIQSSVNPGATVCPAFTVSNNGTRDTSATVTLTYNTAAVTPTTGGSTGFTCTSGTCTLGSSQTLLAGSSFPYSLCFTANALTSCGNTTAQFTAAITPLGCVNPLTNASSILVNGTVTYGSCIDVNLNDNSASTPSVTISGAASLSISSNFTSSAISPSGSSVLSVCYSNSGNTPAPGTTITVTIPTGVTVSNSAWTISATTATYNVGTVAAGAATACAPSLTVTYSSTALGCSSSTLSFVASINSSCGVATTTSTLTPTGTTAITLTKSGPSSVVVGSNISYTLTYTNSGSRTFNTVTLNDTVPANTVYSGTGWTCTPNNSAGSLCTTTVTAGAAVTFQVTVVGTSCTITSVSNVATAQGYCSGNTFFSNIATSSIVTTAITGAPDFYVTKTVINGASSGINAGQSVTYLITYGNNGNRVSDAIITETAVGAPFTYSSANTAAWSAAGANGARTLSLSQIAPGQSGNVTFIVSSATTLANCNNVTVPNTVTIAAVSPCNETNLSDNTASASVSVSAPVDLYITYTAITTTLVIPTTTTANLVFCYGNNGTSGSTNASITITLPTGLTASATQNSGFTISGQTVTYNIGTIAALAAQVCTTLVVNLPSTLTCSQFGYSGTASISSSCTESNTANNQTPWSFNVTANYDLFVVKTQPTNSSIRQTSPQVTYSITYGNLGARSVTPVTLTEYLPSYTTFVASSSDSRWVANGNGTYTIALGQVNANQPAGTAILFTVLASVPLPTGVNQINNTVTIYSTATCGTETNLANNVYSVITPVVGNPDLFVQKTNNGASFFGSGAVSSTNTAFQGDVVVFTISYGNNGDADAINATLTETVPTNTVFDKAHSSTAWSCQDGAVALSICTASVGTVPIAANSAQNVAYGTIQFAVRATSYGAPATLTPAIRCPTPNTPNYVSIAVVGGQIDLNQANNQANASTAFMGLPNLVINKTVSGNSTAARRAGDLVTYTIGYTNNGVEEATGVFITDVIPQYTTFSASDSSVSWSCPNGGAAGTNCTYIAGSVAPGQSGLITIAVVVQTGFNSTVTSTQNCAYIANTCNGGNETSLLDNSACATVPITGYFDLILQKHGYCESILFTMNYENVGTIGARDVFLKTYIPQDTTFDRNNSENGWICTADTPGSECRFPVTTVDPRTNATLDYINPGQTGSVFFAVSPYASSMSATFTLDSSIDDNFTGDNLDPTPDNNRASTTVGFSGCASCDSCCPDVDTCCPDYTDISFSFANVLDGIRSCS